MKKEELIDLIGRLESYHRRHPARYKLRLALLAALGYAYLIVVMVVILVVCGLVVFLVRVNWLIIKVLWIPLALVGAVLRALWVTLPEPDGRVLSPAEAPRLFQLISDLRAATKVPAVHAVLLSDDFNAGIVQIPRLGFFGWQKNYLVIGLPLLEALSPQEFRSVLAHEFGHLSGNHGRFSGWIYRVRQTWSQLLENLQQQRRHFSFVFEHFLDWYAPFFNAYSFVLARAQEYEADQRSVELVGKETAAWALIELNAKDKSLQEEFWPAFFSGANETNQPPKDPFNQLLGALQRPIADPKLQIWFTQALRIRTGYDDTHPSLADRLAAIGFTVTGVAELEVLKELLGTERTNGISAGRYYLNTAPADFVDSHNRLWRERIAQVWREQHTAVVEARADLEKLERAATERALTIEEQWQQAKSLATTNKTAAALPVLQKILESQPEHAGANYGAGQILLDEGDTKGITHLEKAMAVDFSMTIDGCDSIYGFLRQRGQQMEAEQYRARAEEHCKLIERAQEERDQVTRRDTFESHGLDSASVEKLQEQLKAHSGLRKAYLVRKVVTAFPEEPLYVLGVIAKYHWYQFHSQKADSRLVDELSSGLQFPGSTLIVPLEGRFKYLRRVFDCIPVAQISEG